MAKSKINFVCQNCGAQRPKWAGQCSDCGQWNTLVEEKLTKDKIKGWVANESVPVTFSLDQSIEEKIFARTPTQIAELDRVLGGGLVPGSFVLLGGSPGVGKSTLLLQVAKGLAAQKQKILYVSGEESVAQTAARAKRMSVQSSQILLASESSLASILNLVDSESPHILFVDSIQTIHSNDVESAPGSVSQVRDCAAKLLQLAKSKNISVILVGHITKDGSLAGPKVLEHMVDCVLSFEGDSINQFRLIRALKNRFGPTNELGIFKMSGLGLLEITNPSELFLEERSQKTAGSVVFCSMEGSRPLLCEIQALTLDSQLAMPRRTSVGIDINRLHMLAAVIERHLHINLSKTEIYVNAVGGLRLEDPSSDLAISAALLSAYKQKIVSSKSVFMGEIGLTGEVRAISFIEDRIKESIKLGFNHFFVPETCKAAIKASPQLKAKFNYVRQIQDLNDAISGTQFLFDEEPLGMN
jgi:DNA repair protein RadA/Sms